MISVLHPVAGRNMQLRRSATPAALSLAIFYPMDPIVGVDFLQGDFRDELVLKALLERVGDSKVQVVMSDMAPNMCGTPAVDIPQAMYLVELALGMARDVLAPVVVL